MANKVVGFTSVLALTTLVGGALILSSPVSAGSNFAAKCEGYLNGNIRGLSVDHRNACLCFAAKHRKELYKRLEGAGLERCNSQQITNFNLASIQRTQTTDVCQTNCGGIVTTKVKSNNGWGNGAEMAAPPGNSADKGTGISKKGEPGGQTQGQTKSADPGPTAQR